MPYAHRVSKVTIAGTLFGGAEEWSTGFFFGNAGADAQLPTQALADHLRDAWATFHKNGNNTISSSCAATYLKVSSIGTDGKSNPADTVFANFDSTVKGPAPFNVAPQVALAITLTGPQARGLASKGRMYLPMITAAVDGTGHINTVDVNNIRTALTTFFHTVNDTTVSPNVMQLASQGQLNKDGTPKVGGLGPVSHEVTGFKIGNVLDTQRRRRNALSEVYQTVTL